MSTNPLRDLAALLTRVRALEAAQSVPSLPYSSLDDAALPAVDADGHVAATFGRQWDGTTTVGNLVGPTPPTPTAPTADGGPGLATITWGGDFVDDALTPMDFARVEVYLSDAPITDPLPRHLVATIETPQGAQVVATCPPGTYYTRLTSRSLSGTISEMSDQTQVQVIAAPDTAEIEAALATKTAIVRSQTEPDRDGAVPGDLWWQVAQATGVVTRQWQWDGTQWVSQEISGVMIAADTITATQIAAGSITAEALAFGLRSNPIPDSGFEEWGRTLTGTTEGVPPTWSTETGTGSGARPAYTVIGSDGDIVPHGGRAMVRLTYGGTGAASAVSTPWVEVVAGEVWRGSCFIAGRNDQVPQGYAPGALRIDASEDGATVKTSTIPEGGYAKEWELLQTMNYTVPSGVTHIRLTIRNDDRLPVGAAHLFADDFMLTRIGSSGMELTAGGVQMFDAAGNLNVALYPGGKYNIINQLMVGALLGVDGELNVGGAITAVSGEFFTKLDVEGTVTVARALSVGQGISAGSGATTLDLTAGKGAAGTPAMVRLAEKPATTGTEAYVAVTADTVYLPNIVRTVPVPTRKVSRSTVLSVASTGWVRVSAFTTSEWGAEIDYDGTYLTVRRAGIYRLSASVNWAFHATGRRGVTFSLNGSATPVVDQNVGPATAASGINQCISCDQKLTANTTISLMVYQESGAALNLTSCRMSVTFVTEI